MNISKGERIMLLCGVAILAFIAGIALCVVVALPVAALVSEKLGENIIATSFLVGIGLAIMAVKEANRRWTR